MGYAFSNRRIAAVVAAAAGLGVLLTTGALAQVPPDGSGSKSGGADAADKFKDVKINLSAEEENLMVALRALMKSAKADFAIDNDLKDGTVTVHFKDLPFKDALATMIKVSTLPITYELKDGIYHFMRRIDPPVADKPADEAKPTGPRVQAGKIGVEQLGSAAALRQLTLPYNTPPPTLYYHSTTPISHGSVSSFGLSGSGLLQSNGTRFNPDGSISRTGGAPINVFGLLRGLLGGIGR